MDEMIIYAIQIDTIDSVSLRLYSQTIFYCRDRDTAHRIRDAYAKSYPAAGYVIVVRPILVE
jgi:hypothetical protein